MPRKLTVAALVAGLLSGCASAPKPSGDAYADLSGNDLRLAAATMQKALEAGPDGKRVDWANAATGRSGAVKPLRTYVSSGGYFCRGYEEELRHGERSERFRHDACRNERGVWVWL